jgi:ligand-binding SRPBCC domain-containing protein
MTKIHVTTFINAPIERVFNLSRSLALSKMAFKGAKEQLLSSSAANMVAAGETITLRAKHLGKTREITARVTDFTLPDGYTEEQIKGDLKSFRHEYHFKKVENGTIMIDLLEYEDPRDLVGSLTGKFFLKSYFEKNVKKKNDLIRQYAESEKWKAVLT